MKSLFISLVILLLAVTGSTQGIQFESGLTWQQLKEKARSENKFIFVDCYATWCAPCKFMDKMVYPSEKVGAAMKDKFLSVKIQFDSTENDKQEIKQWHQTAHDLGQQYQIGGFPSYLFFSPEGKLVYKTLGVKSEEDFVKMANYAMTNSIEKGSKLMAAYRQGIKDYSTLPGLIEIAKEAGEKELVATMRKDYKANYLDKLSSDSLLTKERIGFLFFNYDLVSSKDNFFKLIYNQTSRVDSIWGEAVCHAFINYTITKEEIQDKLWKNDKPVTAIPNWQKYEDAIRKKYKKVNAESLVSEARFSFYKKVGNWKEFARLKNEAIRARPPKASPSLDFMDRDSWKLNLDAWDVFKFCPDKEVLASALTWSELSIKLRYEEEPNEHPQQQLDTKANLLYKLGRVQEAITLEEKVFELSTNGGKNKGSDQFKQILEKMKKGEPTWPVQ